MSSLPNERLLKPGRIFESCVADIAGPYRVKINPRTKTINEMFYLVIVDVALRVVHVEYVLSQRATDIISALERFGSRYCCFPSRIYSDRGQSLKLCANFLETAYKNFEGSLFQRFLSNKGCRWMMGPSYSHWYFSGVESFVKLVKTLFDAQIFREKALSFDSFVTLAAKISYIVNSRPYLSVRNTFDMTKDVSFNELFVTPGHFISAISVTGGEIVDSNDDEHLQIHTRNIGKTIDDKETAAHAKLNRIYDERLKTFDILHQKFITLYFDFMLKQKKWRKITLELKPGDLVLLKPTTDMIKSRKDSPLARVLQSSISHDGLTRKYVLRTAHGTEVTRSISGICRLEFDTW